MDLMTLRYKEWRKKINDLEGYRLQKYKKEVRRALRKKGYLPEYGKNLTEEQQKIWNDINNGDFSFYDSIKKYKRKRDGPDKIRKTIIKYSPEEIILGRAKHNAKEKKLDFNLDISDIFIPELCPYLKIPISTNFDDRLSDNYYTIDRINSSLGYIKGNVQVISQKANTMKNNATLNELIIFSKSVIELHENAWVIN